MSEFEYATPDPSAGGFPKWIIPVVIVAGIVVGVQQLYYAPKAEKLLMGGLIAEEAQTLADSVGRYKQQYGVLPLGGSNDDTALASEGLLLRTLFGLDSEQNPKETRFYVPSANAAMWGGFIRDEDTNDVVLKDPWGKPFVVVIDYDGDGQVEHPGTKKIFDEEVIVFSKGEDPASHDDDIGSWQSTAP